MKNPKFLALLTAATLVCTSLYAQVFPTGRELSFRLQAHRGLSHRYPENSIPAFREAGKVDIFWGMETDVQMTSDGVLVCMHDNTLDRTTNATGKVSDYTWRELSKFRIDGGTGWNSRYAGKLRIPTFAQYLKICKKYNLVPYVELKLLTHEGVKKTIEMLHDMGFEGKYVLTSFHWDYLEVAARYSNAPLEYMRGRWTTEMVDGLKGVKNCVIRPSSKRLTKEFVEYCHSQGFVVECYGIKVGNAELVSRLREWGVRGGTCNDWKELGLDK